MGKMKNKNNVSVLIRLTPQQHSWLAHETLRRKERGETQATRSSVVREAVELLRGQIRKGKVGA
jgi:hypothetical protein